MRQVDFRASLSPSEFQRLGQSKPSVGLVGSAVVFALAWIFSAVDLGPSQLDFRTLKLGSSGRSSVYLTNRGLTEFHAASIAVEGPDAKDFAVEAQPCATVSPGDSCALWVDFRPRQAGEKHARLIVRTNDGNELSSEFTGVGGAEIPPPPKPIPAPPPTPNNPPPNNPPPETHGGQDRHPVEPVPTTSEPARVATTNPPPTIPAPSPKVGPGPPNPPRPVPPDVVPPYVPVPEPPPGPSPTPPSSPPHRPQPPAPTLYARLSMTPEVAQFNAASSDGEFFNAVPQTVTVINVGTASVRQLNLKIGVPGGAFSYTPTCPLSLAPKQQCAVRVMFNPRDTQVHTDSLTAYDGGARMAAVTLHGSSTVKQPTGNPHVTFNPPRVQFPVSQSDGWVTVTQSVAVINDGTADVQRFALNLTPNGFPFEYSGNCSTRLAKQQSCMLQLKFEQKSQQAYTGTLTAYDGNTALAALPLRGGGGGAAGGHPHLTVNPRALTLNNSFQPEMAYMRAVPTVSARNDGTVDLRALRWMIRPSGSPFVMRNNCPSALALGQTCTVQMGFSPRAAGQYAGTLVAYEGGTVLASVQLSGGAGVPPKQTGGSVKAYVDKAYPNGSGKAANTAGNGTASPGNTPNKNDVPAGNAPAGNNAYSNPAYRAVGPNRAAAVPAQTHVEQTPPPRKNPPARRAAQKPPPQSPPIR